MRERFDVVLYGPTGVTGREVARYLATWAAADGLTWAVAGRDAARIEAVLAGMPSRPAAVLHADSSDPSSIDAMVDQARVVANLVGPYARYGGPVHAACARSGVHQLDLTGETDWVATMIERHHETALASGARIVPTAGFEALPFDLAALLAATALHERTGAAVRQVDVSLRFAQDVRLAGMADAVSGGTFTSGVEMIRRGDRDASRDPYLLDPPGSPAHGRYSFRPRRHTGTKAWLAPVFPSAVLNPPVAHRTAALLRAAGDGRFAPTYRYLEGVDAGAMVPGGLPLVAPVMAASMGALQASFGLAGRVPGALRSRLADGLARVGPKPGQGPRPETLDAWRYHLDVRATGVDGATADVTVDATGHPGYKSTATLVGEAAIVLALGLGVPDVAGYLTPATAIGVGPIDRFARAGAVFTVQR